MSGGIDKLHPLNYLPPVDHTPVAEETYILSEKIISNLHPRMEIQHYGRSAIVGTALYIASVVVRGPNRISQPDIADCVNTTDQSIRDHMQWVAEIARLEVDMSEYSLTDIQTARLNKIADTGHVRDIVTSD